MKGVGEGLGAAEGDDDALRRRRMGEGDVAARAGFEDAGAPCLCMYE